MNRPQPSTYAAIAFATGIPIPASLNGTLNARLSVLPSYEAKER